MKVALALALVAACERATPHVVGIVPREGSPLFTTTALVTAVIDDWSSTRATMRLWYRVDGGWRPNGSEWSAVIGEAGAAWGIGLHGRGAPSGRSGPIKREGDRKSPAGLFALTAAFGYAARAPGDARIDYTSTATGPFAGRWQCVDDPRSHHYGEIVTPEAGLVDYASAEPMLRDDELYRWVVVVDHNPSHDPDAGSCIFLHVWRGPDSTTVGCTAMPADVLEALIRILQPRGVTRYVLLTKADYDALAPAWGLPMR